MSEIRTVEELAALVGVPLQRVAEEVRPTLSDLDRAWIAASPLVLVEEVFSHCAEAFLRSALWDPTTWRPDALPSRAEIAQAQERQDEPLEAIEAYYGEQYSRGLY